MANKTKEKNDSRPFAERHPNWNMVLSMIVLLIIGGICFVALYYGLKYIGARVSCAADWITNVASKMDAVVIVALITGAVSIFGVVLSSIVAKRIDYKKSREAYLAQKREKSYGAFIEMVYKIQQNTKNPGSYTEQEMVSDILDFSQELTLWGSKAVADKWVKFRLNGINPEEAKENLFVLEDIMNEMRKDMGVKRVKKGNLLSFFVNDIKTAMKVRP